MSRALGAIARLMIQSLYAVLNGRSSWYQKLNFNGDSQDEVDFWLSRISEFNGQDIWPKPSALCLVYSDARSKGFGGYTVENGNLVASRQMSARKQHKILPGGSYEQ